MTLKFIADMAAYKYPVIKTVQDRDYLKIAYATDHNELVTSFANQLMGKLDAYNQPFKMEMMQQEVMADQQTLEQLNKSMFQFKFEKGLFKVEVPKNYYALQEFNHQFLGITGLDKIVKIYKSKGNDWNEDLMQMRHLDIKDKTNQKEAIQGGVKP